MSFLAKPTLGDAARNTATGAPTPFELIYMLQEGTGTTTANLGTLGSGWNGEFGGTPVWRTTHSFGNSVYFDASTDVVTLTLAASPQSDQNFTSGGGLYAYFVPTLLTGGAAQNRVIMTGSVSANGTAWIRYSWAADVLTVQGVYRTGGANTIVGDVTIAYTSADKTAGVAVAVIFTWNGTNETLWVNSTSNTVTEANGATGLVLKGNATAIINAIGTGTPDQEVLAIGIRTSGPITSAEATQIFGDPGILGRRKAPFVSDSPIVGRVTQNGLSVAVTQEASFAINEEVAGVKLFYGTVEADVLAGSGAGQTSTTLPYNGSEAFAQRIVFTLTGLTSNTLYYFKISYRLSLAGSYYDLCANSVYTGSSEGQGMVTRAWTAAATTDTFKFAVIGDPHMTFGASWATALPTTRLANLETVLADKGCKFQIFIGDLYQGLFHTTNPPDQADVDLKYQWIRRTLGAVTKKRATYWVPGNWEGIGAYQAAELASYDPELAQQSIDAFLLNPSNLQSGISGQPETFWYVDWGGMRVVGADCYTNSTSGSDLQFGSAQFGRLDSALESTAPKWKMFARHTRLVTNGRVGITAAPTQRELNNIRPMLADTQTHVDVCGHNHIAALHSSNGTTFVEVGTATSKISTDPAVIGNYSDANILAGQKPYCVLIVTVSPTSLVLELWRTSTGTATTDEVDAVAANELIHTTTITTPGSESTVHPTRHPELRNTSLRATALRRVA